MQIQFKSRNGSRYLCGAILANSLFSACAPGSQQILLWRTLLANLTVVRRWLLRTGISVRLASGRPPARDGLCGHAPTRRRHRHRPRAPANSLRVTASDPALDTAVGEKALHKRVADHLRHGSRSGPDFGYQLDQPSRSGLPCVAEKPRVFIRRAMLSSSRNWSAALCQVPTGPTPLWYPERLGRVRRVRRSARPQPSDCAEIPCRKSSTLVRAVPLPISTPDKHEGRELD